MTMCGLANKDKQLPLIIDKKTDDKKTVYILHLPAGLCLTDFEKQKEELSEGFGGTVEIEKAPSGETALTVYKGQLGNMYQFEIIDSLKPMEFAVGYSHKGLLKIDLQGVDPHMAIGGATNSGKSVFLKVLITAAILKPKEELIISLCDMKKGVEFAVFAKSSRIDNYAKDAEGTLELLSNLTDEMNRRLDLLAKYSDIENIKEYNRRFKRKKLPYHLLVVDEFTLLKGIDGAHEMMDILLCQARAVGIHIAIALQTHHAENLPGTIKTNLGTIVSFKMRNEAHSRILLECGDAAKLRGMGHGLLLSAGTMQEFQGFYIDSQTVRKLIKHTYVEKKEHEPEIMGVIPSDSSKT